MKFEELEYIALEGGGGKGAVYLGAIKALEELCKKDTLNLENTEGVTNAKSILDYTDIKTKTLKIKGISGSSAGAITAFPLALGLNSDDIKLILSHYPFSEEFLPNNELHIGKYRMVGMDANGEAKILIAEDHLKKLGESKIEHFQYSGGSKVKIGSSFIKGIVRGQVISQGISIILIGLKDRVKPIKDFIEKIQNYLKDPNIAINYPQTTISNFFKFLNFLNDTQAEWIAKNIITISKSVIIGLLKKLNIKPNQWKAFDLLPSNNIIPAIGNIIWDRGIYAGFEVRDFFFKILLLALSKDTHFRRGFINSVILKKIHVEKKDIEDFKIEFNDKFEVIVSDISKTTIEKLTKLPEILTFSELHKIINLNLSICVTNATTNQPIYFSDYFTPDFPVLEAVGSSMNFPICFKPTYNEANVIKFKNNTADFGEHDPSKSNLNIHKETFSIEDYNTNLSLILSFIKKKKDLQISINSNLSFRSYLPYLRRIIIEDDFGLKGFDAKGQNIKNLCLFYYNSAFKGLLIDGGVTNNLPTSIFTFTTDKESKKIQNLDVKQKTLSIKLDNTFPPELKKQVFDYFKKDSSDEEGINSPVVKNFRRILRSDKFKELSELIENPQLLKKILKKLKKEYKSSKNGFTPWNKQVNAISALSNSLQFGFDQGQIENIEDNENIIALYCYGLGVFDFDLNSKDLKPLVELANTESENSVNKYFE